MRIRTAVAVVLVVLSAGGACSSKKDAKSANSTTTVTPMNPTTTVAPTTTVKGKTTATTSPSAAKATTAEAAASRLFDAWKAGDKTKARQVATEAAVSELFSHPYSEPAPTFQGCDPDGSTFICSYTYEGGATQFTVSGSAATGFTVTKVGQIAD